MLSIKQQGVAKGMLAAFTGSVVLYCFAVYFISPPLVLDSLEDRLGYSVPWLLLPAFTQIAGIAYIAAYRFFNDNIIDGGNPDYDLKLSSARAYLQNTSEQLVLAVIIYLSLSIILPVDWLQIIPALAIWFCICRLLFAIGYKHGAVARSFGFAGTLYASIIGFLLAAWFAFFA